MQSVRRVSGTLDEIYFCPVCKRVNRTTTEFERKFIQTPAVEVCVISKTPQTMIGYVQIYRIKLNACYLIRVCTVEFCLKLSYLCLVSSQK